MKHSTSPIARQKRIFFGLATVYRMKDGTTQFKFAVWNILGLLLGLFILAWVTFFSAAFVHFKYRRGYKDAPYFQTLAYPFLKESFQKKRGEYYINSAFEALEQQDYKTALNQLRAGLIRSPEHIKARRTLSEFYEFAINRPQLAFDLLNDGVPFLSDGTPEASIDYIQNLLLVGSRNQMDEKIVEACNTVLAELSDQLSDSHKSLIYYQKATALRNKGSIEPAQEIINDQTLTRFAEGAVLQAQINWDKGFEDNAIQSLERGVLRFGNHPAIYEKLIALLIEKQRFDKAFRYIKLYCISKPNLPNAHLTRLDYAYKHLSENECSEFEKEFLKKFESDFSALQQASILASKYGRIDTTKKLIHQIKLSGPNTIAPLLLEFVEVESMIRADHPAEAIERIHLMESEQSDMLENADYKSILLSMKTAAYHGLGNASDVETTLNELLQQKVIKIDRYLAVAYLFLEVDAPEIALRIMNHCMESQVYNSNVKEALISIHLKSGDVVSLTNVLDDAISTRRLPNRLLIDSFQLLSSDKYLHIADRERVMDKIQNCFSSDYLF